MPSKALRPVLAGNSLAGIEVLGLLCEAWPADDILVVAPPEPDRHGWQPSLAEEGRRVGVRVVQPEQVNAPDVIAALRSHGADLLLSVYYTQIFRPELLGAVEGAAVNFHPSLLPRHRGTAPLIWAIAEGDRVTGVSAHHLTAGIDTGPLIDQAPLPIHPDDTGYSLHLKAAVLVKALAARLLRRVAQGEAVPKGRPQSGPASTHSTRDPSLNHIDWEQPRQRVRDIVRALAPPLPGAYVTVGEERVVLERVEPAAAGSRPRAPGMFELGRPGAPALLWAADGALEVVSCRHRDESLPGAALGERLGVHDGDMVR